MAVTAHTTGLHQTQTSQNLGMDKESIHEVIGYCFLQGYGPWKSIHVSVDGPILNANKGMAKWTQFYGCWYLFVLYSM